MAFASNARMLGCHARDYPDKEALVYDETRLTAQMYTLTLNMMASSVYRIVR
jgi:hypothetical protein